jgi:hypothetical protein
MFFGTSAGHALNQGLLLLTMKRDFHLPSIRISYLKSGAGSGIRARDFWTWAFGHHLCSPDYESGALARLGYPGKLPLFFMADVMLVCFP